MLNILKTQGLNDRQLLQLIEVSLALHNDEVVTVTKRDLERLINLARCSLSTTNKIQEYISSEI